MVVLVIRPGRTVYPTRWDDGTARSDGVSDPVGRWYGPVGRWYGPVGRTVLPGSMSVLPGRTS